MKESQGALKLEIEIMKMLDHPCIVMLFEVGCVSFDVDALLFFRRLWVVCVFWYSRWFSRFKYYEDLSFIFVCFGGLET